MRAHIPVLLAILLAAVPSPAQAEYEECDGFHEPSSNYGGSEMLWVYWGNGGFEVWQEGSSIGGLQRISCGDVPSDTCILCLPSLP